MPPDRNDRTGETIQKFNDDLLFSEDDQNLAALKYSSIYHVLDDPELRETFKLYDERAKRSKHVGRLAGAGAIVLGAIALIASATEPLAHQSHSEVGLAFFGGLLGLLSVYLGMSGSLTGKRKRYWLIQRFASERLRQFHFQELVHCVPDILHTVHRRETLEQFKNARRLRFETFRSQVLQKLDSHLTHTLSERGSEYVPLCISQANSDLIDESSFKPIETAYRELRIQHQADYANFKLSESQTAASLLPTQQAHLFDLVGTIAISFLLLVHFVAVLAVVYGHLHGISYPDLPLSQLLPVFAMWIAIIALAVNAFERGLQPEREIERYTAYLHGVQAIMHRFEAAQSPYEKLRVMEDMERLSYAEMRDFLATFSRAKFII